MGYSVRVRLGPVLTRVVTAGQVLRGDPLPWLEREVAVAGRLAALGAPVVPPWEDAGPHRALGLDVTLWEWVDPVPGEADPALAGALVGVLHDALADVDLALPVLVGPLTDVAAGLRLSDDEVLHAAAGVLVPLARSWPRRLLHGDAHTGNVLLTGRGPLWCDLEDACSGPPEWDLASATLGEEAVAAYESGGTTGAPHTVDRGRLAACRDLRRLQVLACALTDDVQDAALVPGLRRALAGVGR